MLSDRKIYCGVFVIVVVIHKSFLVVMAQEKHSDHENILIPTDDDGDDLVLPSDDEDIENQSNHNKPLILDQESKQIEVCDVSSDESDTNKNWKAWNRRQNKMAIYIAKGWDHLKLEQQMQLLQIFYSKNYYRNFSKMTNAQSLHKTKAQRTLLQTLCPLYKKSPLLCTQIISQIIKIAIYFHKHEYLLKRNRQIANKDFIVSDNFSLNLRQTYDGLHISIIWKSKFSSKKQRINLNKFDYHESTITLEGLACITFYIEKYKYMMVKNSQIGLSKLESNIASKLN